MSPPAAHQDTREQYLLRFLEAVIPLKGGPDPELTLELLIQAAAMLKDHLECELAELRQEQAE